MERPEVLDLAVEYIKDVKTLVRCCLASKRAQSRCKCHVQQHLPALLTSAHAGVVEDYCNRTSYSEDVHRKPVEWIYHTAGRQAVSTPEVATALLCCGVSNMPRPLRTQLVPMALEHGMQLTAAAVVAAAKARAPLSKSILRQLMPNASLPATIQAVLLSDLKVLKTLLPQLTPEQMPDLLHIAVNTCPSGRHACPALLLLKHDKEHTHTLHGEVGSSSSTDSHSRSLLAEQLLTTSIIRRHYAAAQKLAATTAAQALGTAAVLRLLYLAVENDEEEGLIALNPGAGVAITVVWPLVTAVCEIPAARSVDAAKLGSLMHFAMTLQGPGTVVLLSTLPQVQQLTPKQVFKLMLLAASEAAGEEQGSPARELLQLLAALPSAKQLAPGDAFRLLRVAVEGTCNSGESELGLEDLHDMDLGSQLTGSELLQLLVMSTKIDGGCISLSGLQPAADLIDDEAGYVEFLEQAMSDLCEDGINTIAMNISLTQRLGINSAVRLIQKYLRDFGQGYIEEVYPFLVSLPALQQISAPALGQLLLQAAVTGAAHNVVELLAVPAASQLPTTWLKVFLQSILAYQSFDGRLNEHGSDDLAVIPKVLALPAAGLLSAADVAELLLLAISLEWRLKHEPVIAAVVEQLLALPAAAQLAEASAMQLLQAAVMAKDVELLSRLCALAATQHLSEEVVRQLYQLALDQADANIQYTLQEQLPQVAAVAAAVKPTAEQLEKQMQRLRAAVVAKDAELVSRSCALSAMRHMSEEAARQLHQLALEQADANIYYTLQEQLPQVAAVATAEMRKVSIAVWFSPEQEAIHRLVQALWELQRARARNDDAAGQSKECPEWLMIQRLESLLFGLRQLDDRSCEDLLQQGLQGMHSCRHSCKSINVFRCLLLLPAMQALPAGVVARLLLSGMQLGVQRSVLQTLHGQLPADQQLSCDDVRGLLWAALEARDQSGFTWLRGLPAAPDDDEVQAWWAVLSMPSS